MFLNFAAKIQFFYEIRNKFCMFFSIKVIFVCIYAKFYVPLRKIYIHLY